MSGKRLTKRELVEALAAVLEERCDALVRAARETRAGANDAESRQEGKYDTRAIEAGYLAQGQAGKAAELAEAVATLRALTLRDFAAGEPVATGALVEVAAPAGRFRYLLVPVGGGTEIDDPAGPGPVTALTPESPLGAALLGARVGDEVRPNPRLPAQIVEAIE